MVRIPQAVSAHRAEVFGQVRNMSAMPVGAEVTDAVSTINATAADHHGPPRRKFAYVGTHLSHPRALNQEIMGTKMAAYQRSATYNVTEEGSGGPVYTPPSTFNATACWWYTDCKAILLCRSYTQTRRPESLRIHPCVSFIVTTSSEENAHMCPAGKPPVIQSSSRIEADTRRGVRCVLVLPIVSCAGGSSFVNVSSATCQSTAVICV